MKQKQNPIWWLIILLAIIKFILPFLLESSVYELQRDEFLYYQQGQHLALGYLENPPLLSYLGSISHWLGGTEYWIKCWPSLFGALTLIITCLLTAELGGKFFAQTLAGIVMIVGAFLRVHALFQPNMLDVFFWTLSIYFLILFIRSQKSIHLYALAISLALGYWGKYSIVFLAVALVIALLISKQRSILFQKRIFTAALVTLIIILPNLYWQYAHKWPLIHHMQELQQTQLHFINPKDFLIGQLLMSLAAIFVWIGGLIWLFRNKEFRFLAYAYVLVLLLLIVGSGKSYYSLGIYPMLFAAGAVAWQQWTGKIKWLRSILILIIVFISYRILPLSLPIWEPEKLAAFYKEKGIDKTGLLKWEDQRVHSLPQDFADMLGRKELTRKTESFFDSLPDSVKNNTVILCSNYGQAGSLIFYAKDENFKKRIISTNGSFLLWIPDSLGFKHLIFVADKMLDKDVELFHHFEKFTVVDSVTDIYSRQLGDKIIFFRQADNQANKLATDHLNEMKKVFSR